jgi:hypothetical protein
MLRSRRFAVGDPQAPFARFREVLDRHGLLAADGSLADDVLVISIGDHFDYGAAEERRDAAHNGLELLSWLASHPPDQVVLIAGNHDLGRVGELAEFSDEEFEQASLAATAAYRGGDIDPALERRVVSRYPALPTAEVAARDFAAFCVAQRELVVELLRARRLRLAHAEGDRLFCHAGVTVDYLRALGIPSDARASDIADELNRRLDEAFDAWTSGPLAIPSIHRPGSSATGEGVGMLYHRPANPTVEANRDHDLTGIMSRRFDARRIPLGLTQVIGHIQDKKCRQLLGPWADDTEARGGVIRHLVSDGETVCYAHGPPPPIDSSRGAMVFIDGGMNRTPVAEYELLEL